MKLHTRWAQCLLLVWICWPGHGVFAAEPPGERSPTVKSAGAKPPAAVATTQQRDIEALLQRLAQALSATDEAAVLSAYDPTVPSVLEPTRREVQGLRGRTALAVTLRVAHLRRTGDAVEAVVLRSVSFDEYQRRQMEQHWRTLRLRQTDSGWRISADDEWDGVRTLASDLDIELLPEQRQMRGQARLQVAVTATGSDRILLELNRGLEITGITDAQREPVRFQRTANAIEVQSVRVLRAGEQRVLNVSFAGALFNESKEQGYSQVAISTGGSFASWVTAWYPRLTGNASKAQGKLQFLVPAGIKVASNGRLDSMTSSAAGDRYTFVVGRPLDFSFAAARYQLRTARVDDVQVGIYLLSGDAAKADLYQAGTERLLRLQRGFYGGYPFDAYAVVEIPAEETGALGGSSEQGMNFFPVGVLRDRRFPLPLVAHEMGHSWWGNLVKSRDNAMLDEGLAQLTAMLCVRELDGEAAMRRFVKVGYPEYRQSANAYFKRFATPPGKDYALGAPPTGADASAALHDLADTKGMMVYSMLRDLIGEPALLQALRELATRFADQKVSLVDLREALQKASGRNLDTFFQQWFLRTGAPELTLETTTSATERGYKVSGTLLQAGDLYEMDVEIVLAAEGARVAHTVHLTGRTTAFSLMSEFEPRWVVLDPQYKVLRWTPELRNAQLLERGRALTSLGKTAAAVGQLEDYVRRAPDSLEGRSQLGIALLEARRFALAEASLRRVLDYHRHVQVFEPAVSASQLNLARLLDLTGRRSEALLEYQHVLDLPDEGDAHAAGRAGMIEPYVLPARVAGPSRATLLRYMGEYRAPQGFALSVSVDALDVMELRPALPGRSGLLEWVEGARFRPAGSMDAMLEFSDEPQARTLTLRIGERVIELQRQE